MTKRQLNPSRFGNRSYKLTVCSSHFAKNAMWSIFGTVRFFLREDTFRSVNELENQSPYTYLRVNHSV